MAPICSPYLDRPTRSMEEAVLDRLFERHDLDRNALAALLDGLDLPVAVVHIGTTSIRHQIVYINPAFGAAFGFDRRDVLYRTPWSFHTEPDGLDQVAGVALGTDLRERGRAFASVDILARDGNPMLVNMLAGMIRIQSSKKLFYAAIYRIVQTAKPVSIDLQAYAGT